MNYDLIIVGAGPAGMTAALYALRASKNVLLLDASGYGGQITLSDCVENYPGAANINGYDLAEAMMSQLRAFGDPYRNGRVDRVEKTPDGFSVHVGETVYTSRALILATGVTHRRLDVPGESERIGRGVSFCAVCDGNFFRKKDVAVIGGGNTALQDALFLSPICNRVYLIHRRDRFRAEERLMSMARDAENITILTDTVAVEMKGEGRIEELVVKNTVTQELTGLALSGVFEAVGSIPQNGIFEGLLPLDADGYFDVGEDCTTPVEGLYVAGDARRKRIRQLTTAVSDGTVSALAAIDYLDTH